MRANSSTLPISHLLLALTMAFSGYCYGYNIGSMSGIVPYLTEILHVTPIQTSLYVSAFLWGIVLIMPAIGFFSAELGRKKCLIGGFAIESIALILMRTYINIKAMIFFRLLSGIGVGLTTLTATAYLAEVLPATIRGRGIVAFQFFLSAGILISTIASLKYTPLYNISSLLNVGLFPAFLLFFLAFFVPNPPSTTYLGVLNNKFTRFSSAHIKPLLLACSIGVLNQLSGINAFIQYDSRILFSSGFTHQPTAILGSILITSVNLLATFIAMTIADRYERRNILKCGLLGMFVCLLAASLLHYLLPATRITALITNFLMCAYILSFAVAPGALVYTLMSEILPSSIRTRGLSICLLCSSTAGATLSTAFIPLQQHIGLAGIFLLCTIVSVVYIYVANLLPNTKQKSLIDIERQFRNKNDY